MNFVKKVRRNFYLSSNNVHIWWLIGDTEIGIKTAKFQHNLSIIMPAR